ncbi:MAG: tRNA (adenosine(37)-N6)-threonylcarbamoyltransferase complex transferase subunit TsaD [Candidatus Saccharimonadales bacterium]
MNILGVETSCDETAAAVVTDGTTLLSHVVVSQIDIHREFGGVVPEIASRSHIEVILPVISKALDDARLDWEEIDGIAVTFGPGLSGSLLIGSLTARTLALLKHKPLYPIHHVEAHTYANFIIRVKDEAATGLRVDDLPSREPSFPLLSLTVSGGHSQLVLFQAHGDYRLLGQTQDDAVGEAFDKVAKVLGLEYPGGPAIAQAAKAGDPKAYKFPISKLDNPYDFSFSGLKTAVLRHLQNLIGEDFNYPSHQIAMRLSPQQINDTAASFQLVAVQTLVDKTVMAQREYTPRTVVIAGGVAANQELRHQLREKLPVEIEYAPSSLCTDNAAMIAALGYYKSRQTESVDPYNLEIAPSLSM